MSDKIANLLICHDFKGSYHPTEATQGLFSPGDREQESVYTAEYLQYTTTFTYFSHKRVSIPPAVWINVCHRSGVKVLGTFLVEHSEGSSEAGRLFEKGSEGEYLFATQLERIRETYGFDGWLLNIESSFPLPWSPLELQKWIKELKAAGGEVVWYDAVTVLNQVHWQNELTLLNAPFLYVSDGIFTNYGWREREIRGTKRMADVMGRASDSWMGIDCYGRGSLGDGGFGVTVALDAIQKYGLAAAMFAPGWTWENFEGKGFHEVERKFWVGDGTPQALGVAKYVTNKPAGTSSFFYTAFNRGFGRGFWLRGKVFLPPNKRHLMLTSEETYRRKLGPPRCPINLTKPALLTMELRLYQSLHGCLVPQDHILTLFLYTIHTPLFGRHKIHTRPRSSICFPNLHFRCNRIILELPFPIWHKGAADGGF